MTGKITAIIPTYNRAHFLPEALASIANQGRPVSEIIVWDDGSDDETPAVVEKATGPVRYFRSENGGKSRALNAAIPHATGDYIWICDDDDIALPHAAETLAGILDRDADVGVSGAGYRRFQVDPVSGEHVETGPGYWPNLGEGSVLRHLLEDIFLFQNATLVRRDCYTETGPFREDLTRSIDYDMIARLAARYAIHMTSEPVFLQRKHDGVRGPSTAMHAARDSDAVWKKADRAVFRPFRDSLPLALYEGMYSAVDDEAMRRAALLQRACVYARRTDWSAALEDFAAAAALHPLASLSDTEHAICRRAVSGKHGYMEMSETVIVSALADLARSSNCGRGIVRGLMRGLTSRLRKALRERDFYETRRLGALFARFGTLLLVGRGAPLANQMERSTPSFHVGRET